MRSSNPLDNTVANWFDGGMIDLTPISRARNNVERAQERLRSEITRAFNERTSDTTVEDIAQAAGLTRQRIYQIVTGERPKDLT